MKKCILYIIIIAIVIFPTLFIYFNFIKNVSVNNKQIDYGRLVSVSYSCSGDMLGNVYSLNLDVNNSILTKKYAGMHSDPITETTYNVDKKYIDIITDIVNRYSIASLDNREFDDTLFAYDACSPSISLEYKTGPKSFNTEYYSISLYYKMSNIERYVVDRLELYLRNLVIDENIVSANITKSD